MRPAGVVLVTVNAVFASVFGWLLARDLAHGGAGKGRFARWLVALSGVYLAECVAFSASMGTNLLGIGLAVIWGLVFAKKLQHDTAVECRRRALRVALYTCLPAVSFASALPVLMFAGWPILTAEGGRRLGIPAFVPWPASTVLGFFLTVVGVAVVCKTAVTFGIVWAQSRKQPASPG